MGRERPRLRIADAAPRPSGGVAHAPRVSVGDVLGRATDSRWKCAWKTTAVSRKTMVGNEPKLCPASIEFPGQEFLLIAVAPALDFAGALGRVKGSLAPLAAPIPGLSRP